METWVERLVRGDMPEGFLDPNGVAAQKPPAQVVAAAQAIPAAAPRRVCFAQSVPVNSPIAGVWSAATADDGRGVSKLLLVRVRRMARGRRQCAA